MTFTLRVLEEGDLDTVLRFWTGVEGIGLNESDTPPRLAAFLRRNPGLSRLAIDANRIVGAVLCGHDGRRGTLHHLAVAGESRGQGIGRALVEACLRGLADEGILKCNVFLFADNDLGRSFWEQAGWKQRLDLHVLQRGCSSNADQSNR